MELILKFSLSTLILLLAGSSTDCTATNECSNSAHPLDPLSPDEIHQSAVLIRSYNNTAKWIFNRITLHEPSKSLLINSFLRNEQPQKNIPRRSYSVLINSDTRSAVEVVTNLSEERIETWKDLPGNFRPGVDTADRRLLEDLLKNDIEVQERCGRLGWTNLTLVVTDLWPLGYVGDRKDVIPTNRLYQSFFYGKMFPADNEYAHPFDFVAIVDLTQRKVVSIEDLPTRDSSQCSSEPNTVPRKLGNYDPALLGGDDFLRSDLKPVQISQPEGSSVVLRGNLVYWQKFQFRVGFNEREGAVIHQVGYYDDITGTESRSRFRPLFYRLSLSETYIPYGDSRPPYHRKGAFDMGEIDIGVSANELDSERYCLGENVKFLDAYVNDDHGEPITLKRAICIYEEDAGILWKRTDVRTGRAVLVRAQRLNVAFMATIGNYDYLFTWHFNQDGSIQYEVGLTGILSTNLAAIGSTPAGHGTLVAPQINAIYHQHIFAVRIDSEIDGNRNTIGTLDYIQGQRPTETRTKLTRFQTAKEARTYGSHELSRSWLIMSENGVNPYSKTETAYKLMPRHHSSFVVLKDSPLYPRGEFSEYDVWVTPYRDDQLYAGGRYLNSSGLPQWTAEAGERSIEKADVVLWHVFRITHIPRDEDWPIMPIETGGFTLKPYNFFRENPSLDAVPLVSQAPGFS